MFNKCQSSYFNFQILIFAHPVIEFDPPPPRSIATVCTNIVYGVIDRIFP